jgi:hypothetical protein
MRVSVGKHDDIPRAEVDAPDSFHFDPSGAFRHEVIDDDVPRLRTDIPSQKARVRRTEAPGCREFGVVEDRALERHRFQNFREYVQGSLLTANCFGRLVN